ncbi:hypothetical protein BDV93DRAFT_460945 [Ceratobasidium sp. AG-I]|nr:hypothetical protein BDV93DRAFT_461574 [Ceratobasidium sp. AG-I]KAF8593527.1 hypothetical protein BDV93DRAFT_460945 [Ceratobasidium sp. AG-I]
MIRRYIETNELPVITLGHQNISAIENETVAGEIKLHLQSKGKYVCAEDIVTFLDDASVQENLGIKKPISIRTAHRWLSKMGYRWKAEPKGQYFDGHERPDVVDYRQNVFIPTWRSLEPFMVTWDDTTGALIQPQLKDGQKEVIFWFHDESIFYAHDQRRIRWVHISERATPYKKGEGVSIMVSDFISTEGFLQSQDRTKDARSMIYPGKNRDGYITNDDICAQFKRAVELVQHEYPDKYHVFVYDNARTHTKRTPTFPCARYMTKGPSDRFAVEVVDTNGDKKRVRMDNPTFPDGSIQSLYFPENHPTHPRQFKGMVELLKERGIDASKLNRECPAFKCIPNRSRCCVRRILFDILDAQSPPAVLESLANSLGSKVIFLPKFHCELNPIEQVWGYAKSKYRTYPASSLTADLRANVEKALGAVPNESISRFVQRSHRFVHAYASGKDGTQAAEWARKVFKRHRESPSSIPMYEI